MSAFPYRIGLQQRILPSYRVPFFEALGFACDGNLSVFAGQPRPEEAIEMCYDLKGVRVQRANNIHLLGGMAYLCWQKGILGWLEEWQPDILIAEANPRYLRTPAAVHWMKKRGLPVIGWGLGAPLPVGRLASIRKYFRHNFYGGFDAMIAYSSQGAKQYVMMGTAPEDVYVAQNAASFRPKSPPPQRIPDFSQKNPVVLFVGRLVERKRVDSLIRVCAKLADRKPDLWIVGDGPHRQELEKIASESYPQTRFYGAVFGEALDEIFDKADIFVLPGTGGLAVQQAMSHALPVIVAEADGTQADLVRPDNGWVVPPGDEVDLRGILASALDEPERLREMGLISYQIVSEEINLENMVNVFLQAIMNTKMKR